MKQSSKDPFEVAFEEDEDENNEEEEENNTTANNNNNNNQSVKLELDEDYDEEEEEEKEENEEENKDKSIESPIRGDNEFDDETPTTTTSTTNRRPGKEVVTVDADCGGDGDELRRTGNVNVASSTQNQSNKKRKIVKSNKEDEDEEDDENMDVDLAKFTPTGDPAKMAKMQEILSQLTDEQMSRYESFRRSGFQKANMKKLLASIIGTPKISVPMTIVVSGIAKMFVGELVETGRMVMTERGETGPIRPCHIREAYRRLKLEGKVPKKSVPRLFR